MLVVIGLMEMKILTINICYMKVKSPSRSAMLENLPHLFGQNWQQQNFAINFKPSFDFRS